MEKTIESCVSLARYLLLRIPVNLSAHIGYVGAIGVATPPESGLQSVASPTCNISIARHSDRIIAFNSTALTEIGVDNDPRAKRKCHRPWWQGGTNGRTLAVTSLLLSLLSFIAQAQRPATTVDAYITYSEMYANAPVGGCGCSG